MTKQYSVELDMDTDKKGRNLLEDLKHLSSVYNVELVRLGNSYSDSSKYSASVAVIGTKPNIIEFMENHSYYGTKKEISRQFNSIANEEKYN